jgi:hypothetical protein
MRIMIEVEPALELGAERLSLSWSDPLSRLPALAWD